MEQQKTEAMMDLSDDASASSDLEESLPDLKNQAATETKNTLARRETKQVFYLRILVVLTLLATAIACSLLTYFYTQNVEEESFESAFYSFADAMLRSFVDTAEHKLGAMDTMSTTVTSHALSSGETFPNVTVPDFEVKGSQLRVQTDGVYMFWLPLVTDEERRGYELYTQSKQAWLFESYVKEEGMRQYQDAYFEMGAFAPDDHEHGENGDHTRDRKLHVGTPEEHPVMHDKIWGIQYVNDTWIGDTEPDGSGPFLACWQLSPTIPVPALLNYNFFAYRNLAPMMSQALTTGTPVLGPITTDHEGSDTEDLIRVFLTLNQYRHDAVGYDADPMTHISYPVFDNFGPTKEVTGIVLTTIFWRLFLEDVLPSRVQGLICVISNSLGEQVTYQVDGGTATLLGAGDLHSEKYDDMVVSRGISEYLSERAGPTVWSYTSLPLDTNYTAYSMHVYPSDTMYNQYSTNEPWIFALVIAAVFFFTSFVFILYDFIVERRQKKVMDTAVKSTAVVDSLFPAAVRDRLYEDEKSAEFSNEMTLWKNDQTTDQQSEAFTTAFLDGPTKQRKKGRPIAEKFEHTTVFFADLAGFTKWSSTREPEQVFELLETLFGAFDKIALRRKVFKVETIGDCYMACTGLPEPQPDHALRMIKFANDCIQKMRELTESLERSLGSGTDGLTLRVGVNSGPVTAGVLRGDKTRFQLFGDTVNTAARMESNGIPGKIHCSASTADELIVWGKKGWVINREDKITAKGKGEMQTYFIEVPAVRAESSIGRSSRSGGSEFNDSKAALNFEGADPSIGKSLRR